MLGPYGNAWISTPTFNRLACESVLFDRYYPASTRLDEELGGFWNRLAVCLPESGFRSLLLSDDAEIFRIPGAEIFDRQHRLDPLVTDSPANSLEETRIFKTAATIVDLLSESETPFFLWSHLAAFRGSNSVSGHWDYPLEYREIHRDEEDPEPYGGVEPPQIVCRSGEMIDPDDLQSVMEAYSGGVSVLDAALDGLLGSMEEIGRLRDTLLVLCSTRGFSLGEHGVIGPNTLLFSENVQLPLFIRFPDARAAMFRTPALVQSGDLADFLVEQIIGAPTDTPTSPCLLSSLIREETDQGHSQLFLDGDENRQALVTPHWLLRDGNLATELYVKPDDRWEVNDVADRCPEIVEQLRAMIPRS